MKQFGIVMAMLVAGLSTQSFGRTYVGSADSGLAHNWPVSLGLEPTGTLDQVILTLNRETHSRRTGRSTGSAVFNVGFGEGHRGTDYHATYVREGNNLYLDFENKNYEGVRKATLGVRNGVPCVFLNLLGRRVTLCEGPIGM